MTRAKFTAVPGPAHRPAGVKRDGDHYGDNLGTGEVSPLVPEDTHAGYSQIYSVLM